MYDGDYDFNGDGKLDNNEREFMYDDLDRELNENNSYHVSGSRRKHKSLTDDSGEWTKENTIDWICIVIIFASIVLGLVSTVAVNTKSGEGIKFIGFTMGIGFLIASFVAKGIWKKAYLIISICLSAGALFLFLLSLI